MGIQRLIESLRQIRRSCFLSLLAVVAVAHPAHAVDPSSITSLTDRGLHFEAFSEYTRSRNQIRSTSELLSIARSAWALGLPDEARALWDQVLANPDFAGIERARTLLGRAILELQEGRSDDARRFAESAAASLEPSELRGQLWLVIGEALRMQGAASLAETYYEKAAAESSGDAKSEALFLLGECQLKIGLLDQARRAFAAVKSSSPFSARALRRLMEIELSQRQYAAVLTWGKEGLKRYPQQFEDSWVSYARITSHIQLNQLDPAEQELKRLVSQYPETDPWVALATATYEGRMLERRHPRARLQSPTSTSEKDTATRPSSKPAKPASQKKEGQRG